MTSGAVEKPASQYMPGSEAASPSSTAAPGLTPAATSLEASDAKLPGREPGPTGPHVPPQESLGAVLAREVETAANTDHLFWETLSRSTPQAAMRVLLNQFAGTAGADWREQLSGLLSRQIASIDMLLTDQVNAILHHPRFQQLEASWRGLKFLVDRAADARDLAEQDGGEAGIKVRMLSVSKRELFKDLDGAGEFDQSHAFRAIYDQEFGMPGGEPYGVLLGDYEFTNHIDDIQLLAGMGEVAAAAFAPFLASASPALLGLESLAALEQPLNLERTFQQLEYLKWRSLREREDSRFLGLLLPRTLMRVPYENDGGRVFGFNFSENTNGRDNSHYLWGSSTYAFGSVLIRAFANSGWFADIRGAERGVAGGGLVTGLPTHSFGTDAQGVANKSSTEVALPEECEGDLSTSGFISLCHCQDTGYAAYFGNQSVHRPKQYDTLEATTNAKISAMLQYVMCASRFAHYLKVYVRDKMGGARTEHELERELGDWLSRYITPDDRASPSVKAQFPLRAGKVQIREIAGKPGRYRMVMHLLPHFQLDQLTVALKMVTRLSPNPHS